MQENEEKNIKIVAGSKKSRTFATAIEKQRLQRKRVPWMSGLVSGLQNRVRRFESNIMFIVLEEPDVPEEPDVRLLSSKARKYTN